MAKSVILNESDLGPELIEALRNQGYIGDDPPQGSPEWQTQRLGIPTASAFINVVARTKPTKADPGGTPYAGYFTYMRELLGERMTGKPERFYKNNHMVWGTENEANAADAYEQYTGADIQVVGFLRHDTIDCGASPDRLVNEDGMAEFKCPGTKKHIEYLERGIPPEYYAQVQGELWIWKRDWCDFVSFDPDIEGQSRLYIQHIERDEAYIADMERKVAAFCAELDRKEQWLRSYSI